MKLYDVYYSYERDYETSTVEAVNELDAIEKVQMAHNNDAIIYEVWEH